MKIAQLAAAITAAMAINAGAYADGVQPTPAELEKFSITIGGQVVPISNFEFEQDPASLGWGATLTSDVTIGGATDGYIIRNGSSFFWKADPIINYSFSAQDFGAPSVITFGISAPISPNAVGPHSVRAEFAGAITDGGTDGASITASPANLPGDVVLDSDGFDEIQTINFSTDGGLTLQSMDHDLGFSESFAAGTGPFSLNGTGYVETEALRNIAPPGWDYWQINLAFAASGGNDAYALTGRAEITSLSTNPVPVPAAVWLFGSALGGFGVFGRRGNRK